VSTDRSAKKWDAVVPIGIISIILMMVLPLPPELLDVMLALSLALAIGVFLTTLFMEEALEFSAFPAFVLVATLLRLSLNVATTRLILLRGGQGQGSAGSVVEAFGRFVVEGNVLVGLVVFLILTVINFVVVTKGAGRVAEVAARFTLDSLPGKQMAIDADLASGAITQDAARARRRTLEREADFFGAMDGASKFVHGDAIAGLLIAAINLVGGLVLGLTRGMSIGTAVETFSVLTVGDALASQIPALLISAAAGVVVTRSATGEQLGRALATQFLGRKSAMYITAGVLALLAVVPGMPALPCLVLAGALIVVARRIAVKAARATSSHAPTTSVVKSMKEEIEETLAIDLLGLEVGFDLLPAVDAKQGGTLIERVGRVRCELAKELGIVVPPVHVSDPVSLRPGEYRVSISGNEVARGELMANRVMAIDGSGTAPQLEGIATTDPTFGAPATWIAEAEADLARALGYTIVDHATILSTHIAEVVRTRAHMLLGRQEAQHLVDLIARKWPKLVDDVIPHVLTLGELTQVLKNLLREGVPVRDLRSILEAIGEVGTQTKDPEQLTELVRERMSAHITARFRGEDGSVTALTLEPRTEQMLRASLREIAAGTGGALDPDGLRALAAKAEGALPAFAAHGAAPLVVTAPELRRYVRAIFERKLPQLSVASFREIDPSMPLRIVERLDMTPNN
jgi:flagellar biosynthesis protein FlhA